MEFQDVQKYFQIIRRWWWVIVLLVVTTVSTMLVIAFLSEPQYQATVTIQVSAPPPQEAPLYSEFGRQTLREEIAQTKIGLSEFLQAGEVTWRVIERLPEVDMTGRELSEMMVIDTPEDSQLMRLSVQAPDPELAALLANTIVETGLKLYGELRAKPTANTRQFIEQELEVARTQLKTAEAELTQFQIDNKIGNLSKAIDNQYNFVRSLKLQGDLARADDEIPRVQAIEDIVLEREAELQNMVGLSTEYNELVDRVERSRDTHDFLVDKMVEAQIKENQILSLGSIQVITSARPPQNPLSAISAKVIALGSVVSILAGILLAFLLEYLRISGVVVNSKKSSELSEILVASEHMG